MLESRFTYRVEDVEGSPDAELDIVLEAFLSVQRHRQYVLGPEVELLETRLAEWLSRRHAVGCNSGFGAHLLSLLALGIGAGAKVAVPAFAPPAYIGTIIRQGATPVLVDVAKDDFHMSPSALSDVPGGAVDAVVVHHLFGGAADVTALVAGARGAPVIEVLNYSLGAQSGGKHLGSVGTIATSCLREDATLGAYGDAGMVWTDRPDLDERLRRIRHENSMGYMHEDYVTGNFHQDSLHAAILLYKFEGWRARLEQRRRHSRKIADVLSGLNLQGVTVPTFYRRDGSRFVIFAEDRDPLVAHLRSKGIDAEAWWPVPLYQQPGFRRLNIKKGDFPEAERAAAMSLSLPLQPGGGTKVERIAEELVKYYRE